ncbi:hypothetical protein D3C87_38030 [compost metagenome]
MFKLVVKSIAMLTIIPIYLFGRAYYNLAKLHNRNAWGYGILGAVIFLGAQFVLGFLIGIILLMTNTPMNIPPFVLSLFAIGFGALAAFGVQKLLEKNWSRKPKDEFSELLDR